MRPVIRNNGETKSHATPKPDESAQKKEKKGDRRE